MPHHLPAYRTRADLFDDAVLAAVANLESRWAQAIEGTEFAVEEVPPSGPAPWERGVPLAGYFAADTAIPGRVVLYRRPIADRATDETDLAHLVNDVLVEQVAQILGRAPEEIDPSYRHR